MFVSCAFTGNSYVRPTKITFIAFRKFVLAVESLAIF